MTRPGLVATRRAFYLVGVAIVWTFERIIEDAGALALGRRATLLIGDSLSYPDDSNKKKCLFHLCIYRFCSLISFNDLLQFVGLMSYLDCPNM